MGKQKSTKNRITLGDVASGKAELNAEQIAVLEQMMSRAKEFISTAAPDIEHANAVLRENRDLLEVVHRDKNDLSIPEILELERLLKECGVKETRKQGQTGGKTKAKNSGLPELKERYKSDYSGWGKQKKSIAEFARSFIAIIENERGIELEFRTVYSWPVE